MALPNVEEGPDERVKKEKGKAILTLLITVFVIDAIAIGGFLFVTIFLGWDQMLPFILVIVISVLTGFYCQWQMKKIKG